MHACTVSPAGLQQQLCPPHSPRPAHHRSTPNCHPPSCEDGRLSREHDAPTQTIKKKKDDVLLWLNRCRFFNPYRIPQTYPSMQKVKKLGHTLSKTARRGTVIHSAHKNLGAFSVLAMNVKPFLIALLLLVLSVEASPASTHCSVTETQTFHADSLNNHLETCTQILSLFLH